jgi:hypothetical protein
MAFLLRNRASAPRLLSLGVACALLVSACTSEEEGSGADAGPVNPGGGGAPIDASVPPIPLPVPDASLPRLDAALPLPVDASTPVTGDASLPKPDAAVLPGADGGIPGADGGIPGADGGIGLPNLGDAGLDLGGLLGDGGLFGGGGQPKPDAGSPSKCQNAICIDVFDCYLFHPDLTDCGFTACDFGVCK